MKEWAFITHHGLVLAYIYRHPKCTTREVASVTGVTERTAYKLIGELMEEGYITRRKRGRGFIYRIDPELPLRPRTNRDMVVGDLLKVVAPKITRRKTQEEREVALALAGARLF